MWTSKIACLCFPLLAMRLFAAVLCCCLCRLSCAKQRQKTRNKKSARPCMLQLLATVGGPPIRNCLGVQWHARGPQAFLAMCLDLGLLVRPCTLDFPVYETCSPALRQTPTARRAHAPSFPLRKASTKSRHGDKLLFTNSGNDNT